MHDEQVTRMYTQGKSCAAVAKSDGCSESTMYNRLKSLGVVMRSRSKANQGFPDYIFMKLYNMGLSTSQVGRLLMIDASTVTKRLHTLGYPLRSRCVARKIRYSEEEFTRHFMVPSVIDQLTCLVDR